MSRGERQLRVAGLAKVALTLNRNNLAREDMAMAIDARTEAAIRLTLDKQEIHEVMMRYCRAVDRMDEELLRSVYHPDATDNHGMFNGKAADFVPWCINQLREAYTATQHLVANELIEWQGDKAYCEFYFVAYHHYDAPRDP